MLEIADEIILDPEVALVDRRHERQRVHILQNRPRLVVNDASIGISIRQAGNPIPVAALGDLLDREIEFVARDEVDGSRRAQASRRIDGDLGADQAGLQAGVDGFQRLDGLDVGRKRRRRRMQHGEIEVECSRGDVGELQAMRGSIDQCAAFDQCGRLREPRRIPERANLATRLVARPGAAVETFERRRLQEKSAHHFRWPSIGISVPSARTS